ncbi:MAG: hypothetical protein GY856_22150 [bacterium]|nr:hypothetical protein [bacterium]
MTRKTLSTCLALLLVAVGSLAAQSPGLTTAGDVPIRERPGRFDDALEAVPAADGEIELLWYSVDAGGVTASSASGYQLGGTVGQPDAGTGAAGTYTLTSGFQAVLGSDGVIFRDGFESGDLSAWSTSQPLPRDPAAPNHRSQRSTP